MILPQLLKTKEANKRNPSDQLKKPYDYFSTRIPRSHIEMVLKVVKDERFLFFIKYGSLRRYDGDCEVIYVEIPQIPKKLVIYRRPCIRMKSLEKFNLSQKDLPHIPLFEGEENLKILSLDMNLISKIDQLISLNNLTYLNLYCNRIAEIENLDASTRLRVLLLGKNVIEKIKNLHYLYDLEILDLHSNRIKVVENLTQLKKLRVLNLANNQINSITELVCNKNLEELNVRKNIINSLPNLTNNWEKLKRLNVGKNQIAKVEYLIEIQKLKSIYEVSLEDNPVLSIKESEEIMKSFSRIIKNNPLLLCSSTKNILTTSIQKSHDSMRCISPSLNNHSSNNNTSFLSNSIQGLPNCDLSDLKSAHMINSIQTKWENEYLKLLKLGYTGYNNKRIKEITVIFGHAEIEGEHTLICYGDALKILNHEELYSSISSIHFCYFYYDIIFHKKYFEKIKKFTLLKSINFSDNNIYSFYQLIKLENLPLLENISIQNNEICNSALLKYFLTYRIQNLKIFNNEKITEEDVSYAKASFELFDKCISYIDNNPNIIKEEKNYYTSQSNTTNTSHVYNDERGGTKKEIDNGQPNQTLQTKELDRDKDFVFINSKKEIQSPDALYNDSEKHSFLFYIKNNMDEIMKKLIRDLNDSY